MAIFIGNNQFHLRGKETSYIFGVFNGKLLHYYWGKRLSENVDFSYLPSEVVTGRPCAFHAFTDESELTFVSDMQFEFSAGAGDYRIPSIEMICNDGSPVSSFVYESYRVYQGKPKLTGLPATYAEAGDAVHTLEIILLEQHTGVRLRMFYSVFEEYDVITRSMCVENLSENDVMLQCVKSMRVDLTGQNYSMLHLSGDWARERERQLQRVGQYIFSVDSKRGMSSHMHNPFLALLRDNAGENSGEVYGFSLVYSGNFSIEVEGYSTGDTCVTMGISGHNFLWKLHAGESFQTPEACIVYSANGLNTMSNKFHSIYRSRLCRGKWKNKIRPIVINNWEGTQFAFTEEKLLAIAKAGARAGAEMFVLDDGWFGNRLDDKSSLGDWFVNENKLPAGLKALSEKVNSIGLQFGIWMEPEMISPVSKLYAEHPNWCLHAKGRRKTENRWQYVLDLSRQDVQDYVFSAVQRILRSANITYVKWDCNRNITEVQDTEQCHRYVLGLYSVLQRLNDSFPDVLFESCSGGGGRFDPGMLFYMPQTWTSDNTAPLPRMEIQTGTSLVYPAITMTAHIGQNAIKSGQLDMSAHVAMSANFGLEMDISTVDDDNMKKIQHYVSTYKQMRDMIQLGKMYRLESNPVSGRYAVQFVDSRRSVIFCYQAKPEWNGLKHRIYPLGLDADAVYRVNHQSILGRDLMNIGINVPCKERYGFELFVITKEHK